MSTGTTFSHLECIDCGQPYDRDVNQYPCPACGGILDPQYSLDEVTLDPTDIEQRSGSMWTYQELLPVSSAAHIVSLGEGDTPLLNCPTLANRLGIDRLLVKDEGQNPTNTFKDRGLSAAISVECERGTPTVGIASAGNAGQAASTYAARAGLDCHVYLNQQVGDIQRQLVSVHGAELHLVDGQIGDAGAACAADAERLGYQAINSFQTPYRHDGKKTMGYEIFEDLGWQSPDEIVYPTGGGVGLIGIWRAFMDLRELGWIPEIPPRLVVAQAEGVAPIVRALEQGERQHEPWIGAHSVAKGLEIPDPGASAWIIDVVTRSGGTGVSVSDSTAITAAIEMAQSDGIEMCIPSAVALAGAMKRADDGAYDGDETVVVVNTGAGVKSAQRLAANLS